MDPVTGLMLIFVVTLTETTDLNFDFDCDPTITLAWNASTQTVTCGNFKLDASKNRCTPVITAENIRLNCELTGEMKFSCPGGVQAVKISDSKINSGRKMYNYVCDNSSITAPGNLRLVPRTDK